jgi:hypothetical protein
MLRRILLWTVVLTVAMPCLGQTERQPRVYIEQSRSWALGGWSPLTGLLAAGGGARPQTAEIINTFAKRCPAVTPALEREKADYVLLLEHDGGKSIFRRDNKYAVFTASGDFVQSGSTRILGNAVSQACEAIMAKPASR